MFITGSRGAVIGNLAILGTAAVLLAGISPLRAAVLLLPLVSIGFGIYLSLKNLAPELFVGYQARVDGTVAQSHTQEMIDRVIGGNVAALASSTFEKGLAPNMFGHGLGTMSNGIDAISAYAASIRAGGFWTESDQGNTLFEGGYYLVLVWYGFRLFIAYKCVSLLRHIADRRALFVGCCGAGFVAVNAWFGTLGIMPPLYCWWGLAFGVVVAAAQWDILIRKHEGDSGARVAGT